MTQLLKWEDEEHASTYNSSSTALWRGKAQAQRRLVAVPLNIRDNNTARPGADPPIVGYVTAMGRGACERTAVVVCIALRRGKAQNPRRLVAVSLNIGDNNTAIHRGRGGLPLGGPVSAGTDAAEHEPEHRPPRPDNTRECAQTSAGGGGQKSYQQGDGQQQGVVAAQRA